MGVMASLLFHLQIVTGIAGKGMTNASACPLNNTAPFVLFAAVKYENPSHNANLGPKHILVCLVAFVTRSPSFALFCRLTDSWSCILSNPGSRSARRQEDRRREARKIHAHTQHTHVHAWLAVSPRWGQICVWR